MAGIAIDDLGVIFVDPGAYAEPDRWHAAAQRIRDESPVLKVAVEGHPEFWAITKHADVMEIERNPDIFTNAPMPVLSPASHVDAAAEAPVKTLIQMDGDEHKAHRNIVNDWFKPASVKQLQERIDELARHSVDRMAGMGGHCDFANDVAVYFPLQVILTILGLPEGDYPRMLQLTQELFGAEDPDIARLGDDESMFDVLVDFMNYFTALTEDRRANPTGDLASVIANATIDGRPLPDLGTLGHYVIIATAGHDTTSSVIGGGLLALVEHPDQLELLRADPELIHNAADELIRYVSPVKHFMRTCQRALHPPRRDVRARRARAPVVRVSQQGRRGLRRSRPARRAPAERGQPPGVRVRAPLLPRRAPGPGGDPSPLPGAAPPARAH